MGHTEGVERWALAEHGELVLTLAVVGALLALAEHANPEVLRRARRDPAERRRHLGWLGVYVVVAPVVGALTAGLVVRLDGATPAAAVVGRLPAPLRWLVALAVVDLVAYGLHRAAHRWGPLWRVHAAHHRATDVRWWTAMRFHPVNAALDLTVPYAAAAAVGVGTGAVAGAAAAVTFVALFAHADVHVPGRWLDHLVATPRYHRTHHEVDGHAANLALVLPVWDRLFGTRAAGAAPSAARPRRFGIDAYPSSTTPSVSESTLATALATTAATTSP